MAKVTESCKILGSFSVIIGVLCDLYRFQVNGRNQIEQWAVHVAKMVEANNAYKNFMEDQEGWMKLPQDCVHWWTKLFAVLNLHVLLSGS